MRPCTPGRKLLYCESSPLPTGFTVLTVSAIMDTNLTRVAPGRGRVSMAHFRQSGQRGIALPDPVTMGIALDPTLCTSSSRHFVEIEVSSDLTRGTTVVDRLGVATDPRNRDVWSNAIEQDRKIQVCWGLDIPKWKELLFSALA